MTASARINGETPEPVIPAERPPPTLDAPATPVDVVASATNVALKGLFVLALFYTFYFARAVILPVVLAMLLALILSPAVRLLRRCAVPEPLGAAIIVIATLGALAFGAYQLSGPASEWIDKIPQVVSQVERKLSTLRKSMAEMSKAAERVEQLTTGGPKPAASPPVVAQNQPPLLHRIFGVTKTVLLSAASTVILLYFLLASGDMFLRKLVRVLDTFEDKKRAVGVARAIQSDMARYLFTITCINVGLGVVVGFALYLLGMPNPVLWGVMVAIFNFVPYLGAATNLIILTIVAILTFDDVMHVLKVTGVYLFIEIIEGQIVTPILTGRSLTLNPVMIFIAMLLWTWLWGVVGALIAVPLLMTLKIVCDHVESLQPIGEFLSGRRHDVPDD
ncbi:MAG: AI-2E family transporter [Rhodospirillaceae bacterium]